MELVPSWTWAVVMVIAAVAVALWAAVLGRKRKSDRSSELRNILRKLAEEREAQEVPPK